MKNYIDFNKKWLLTAKQADNEKPFANSYITIPFFHSIETMPECTLEASWTPDEEYDGKTVYLEIGSLWADAEISVNGKTVAHHTPTPCVSRYQLLLEASYGEEYKICISAVPFARPDGMFAFTGVSLIAVDSSHFNMTQKGDGIYVQTHIDKKTAQIDISADIIRPNNYDVVSYNVTDWNGETVFSKTYKPTSPNASFTLENPELWEGQSGAFLYKLNASLLRDSVCLDEVTVEFGIREINVGNDGFLQLNGLFLPLSGVSLTDCSAVKSDITHLDILDGNTLITSVLPTKTDILSHCDKRGILFWYNFSFSGNTEKDMEALKKFLLANRNHPSFCVAVCPKQADNDYFNAFCDTLEEYAPHILTAVEKDLDNALQNIPQKADIVVLDIPCNTQADAFINITGRFSELRETYPEKTFAVFACPPKKSEITSEEFLQWHIRLWNNFYNQKGIIAYFGGTLSDTKGTNALRGLTSFDRTELYDIFRFYESRFSSTGFIKICNTVFNESDSKYVDVKCITNCENLRILINGKDKKHELQKITDGIYVFKNLKLKRGINTVEVSAGDECDYTEIERI